MEKLRQTPSQTIGPFFAYSLNAEQYGYPFNSIVKNSLCADDGLSGKIQIVGSVFDGSEQSIPDAMLELWQCNDQGKYRVEAIEKRCKTFTGFGRMGTGTDEFRQFRFLTNKPASLPGQAPHINVILFMRGSLHGLFTRIYFPDELNDNDPVLQLVDVERRKTLIAQRKETNGTIVYHFDIHMQGDEETVFFNVCE